MGIEGEALTPVSTKVETPASSNSKTNGIFGLGSLGRDHFTEGEGVDWKAGKGLTFFGKKSLGSKFFGGRTFSGANGNLPTISSGVNGTGKNGFPRSGGAKNLLIGSLGTELSIFFNVFLLVYKN